MKYCFLDLETTGFDSQKDSIIEASFIVEDGDKNPITTFDKVIIPHNSELTPHITHITGITQDEIDKEGVPFPYVQEEINEKLKDCIIIGHNIDFDIGFLIANGINIQDNPRIDTHELVRILLVNEESFALEVLAKKYGFAHHSAHRAMSDVEANKELYYFLLEKIKELPTDFLKSLETVFETKTDWYAKILFSKTGNSQAPVFEKRELPEFANHTDVKAVFSQKEKLTSDHSFFIKQGLVQKSADWALSLAHKYAESGDRVLIISPKLDFFPSVKKFPTPNVLLDPERLDSFLDHKEKLNNEETTFYLKCLYRHFLGFRGVDAFDLFFKERDLWKEVCIESDSSEIFQKIIQERENYEILSISPNAFFQYSHLPLFKDRVLIIDESELFAEKLLFSVADMYSLSSYLDHENEKISVATQFWVSNFCTEVLEQKIQRALSQYPEKIAFSSADIYPKLAQNLLEISNTEEFGKISDLLQTFDPKVTRWMHYYPETGNLSFGEWHIDEWKTKKDTLKEFKKIFLYRHKPSQSNAFFRIFLGSTEGESFSIPSLIPNIELTIPDNLVSVKSPDFNQFTVTKIKSLIEKEVSENSYLVANFSSLETLKKVHHELFDIFSEDEYFICGEKVMGGDGKVVQKILEAKKVVFLEQKIMNPRLGTLPFKTMVIQKFIFSPPHPLLGEIEKKMKAPGISFWDVWTVPLVSANVSRRIGHYQHLEKIIWLDPRENASWGRDILDGVFDRVNS